VNEVNAAMMKKVRISSLTPTITRLTARSRGAADQQERDREHDDHGGQVEDAAVLGPARSRRQLEPERRVEERVEVAAPADRDAATDTPYSRIRSQPMIKATSSPSVA
jgi:hypothetical protein